MTKLVLDFGRVTRIMRVKLTVIVDDENAPKTSKFTKVVDKSNYKGVEYLRVTPHPYITLDISAGKDKSEDWNGNLQINLNTMYKYALCRKLKKLIKCFTEKEDMTSGSDSDEKETQEEAPETVSETTEDES